MYILFCKKILKDEKWKLMNKRLENLQKIYPIQTWVDNPILRAENKKVSKFDSELIEFYEDMVDLMYEYDWVGLAAPQIGKNIRMFVCSFLKDGKEDGKPIGDFVFINPVITEKSEEMVKSEEACLSIPNIVWTVKRHKKITIEYYDELWNKKKKKLKWFNAIVVQHEYDHLEWILFVDNVID